MKKSTIFNASDSHYPPRKIDFHRSLAAGLIGLLLSMPASAGLIVSGVIDGPVTGGLPKAIELYATSDIADLSIYGVGSANNGGGSDGEEFTLSGSASNRPLKIAQTQRLSDRVVEIEGCFRRAS